MSKFTTFGHVGAYGDLIYSLLAVRQLGGGNVLLARDGNWQQSPSILLPAARLLEQQPYVTGTWTFAYGDHLDFLLLPLNSRATRPFNPAGMYLPETYLRRLNLPLDQLDQPWLSVTPRRVAEVVISRSSRFHSPYFRWDVFLKHYSNRSIFVGLPEEYQAFISEFGKVPYHPTVDLLNVAEVIAGSDLFAGNQSAPFALCEGLKHNAMLEVSPTFPDCYRPRNNLTAHLIYG